ncbi:MAG: 16S rRNA (uracil(1498)-N(3))-methyltransferase [Gammaproteobacteria bacterium]|nr:16S rRNA (uracil(1498)-N(3))-methyltransferase [Gammaproteobacteria bacterium]
MQQYFAFYENDKIRINEDDLYHLRVVMRAKDGEQICLIIENKPYLASFHPLKNNDYDFTLICELSNDSELKINIYLYQALIRNENFDLVIQKATELGVYEIIPTIYSRNVVKITGDKIESKVKRFNLISKGASNQSRRLYVPEVKEPINVKNIVLNDGEIGLLAYEKCSDTKSLKELSQSIRSSKGIKVIIGPEGGITEDEYNSLINKGFKPISLGKRILRSETAAISILSMLNYIIEIE